MAETVEYNLNLDLTLHPIQSILIKQYSKNVYKLIVSVTKETVVYVLNDSLYNVYFKMRTPDNRYVYTQGTIDENGRILLDVPESAAWTAGIGEAEFEIIKKDKSSRMSTCTFEVVIDASSYEEAEITGDNDFSALVDYISQAADISDEVAQAKEYRDEAATSATTASQAAQTATTAESFVRGLQESAMASATVAVESKESAEASATTASQAAQSASEDAEATSQALQEAIALYNGPLTAKTAAEMTQTNRIYVYTGSESGYTFGNWYYYDDHSWQSGGVYNATAMDLDDTLTVEGKAADAKAVGDFRNYSTNKFSNLELTDDSIREDVTSLKADLDELKDRSISEDLKQALYDVASHIALWTDDKGEQYVEALYDALYPDTNLIRIEAVFNQGTAKFYTITPLSDLKAYLTVTGYYDDGTSKRISDYALSGELTAGTSTITVSKDGKTDTFDVVVSAGEPWDYEWTYTDGLPNDNGMILEYTGTPTINMTENGLSILTADTTSDVVRYKYSDLPSEVKYTSGVFETQFVVTQYGSYNVAPYGNGIRFYAGLGLRGGDYVKCLELTLNQSGVSYMKAGTSWTVIEDTPITLNSEHTVRIEQTLTEATVYLDGVLIGTYNDPKENVSAPQFNVTRGAGALFKMFRFRVSA